MAVSRLGRLKCIMNRVILRALQKQILFNVPNFASIPDSRNFSSASPLNGEKKDIKSVAIIGSGVAGLSATKSCLEEGLQPVCFEQGTEIGGTWFFQEHVWEGQSAAVYKHLTMNVSKEMTRFSDFPMPADFPTFLSCHDYYSYLYSFMNHFNLRQRIQLNTKVRRVAPLVPGRLDCGWRVTYDDATGREQTSEFDAVMICSGFNKRPRYPEVEGLDGEGIEVKHMQHIRTFDYLKDKNILVIGNQNSAGDAANLASDVARSVILSIGDEGTNIVSRWDKSGLPTDVASPRWEVKLTPRWLSKRLIKNQANSLLCHKTYGLTPRKETTKVCVMINDGLPQKIREGEVMVKPRVLKVQDGMASFSDGSTAGPIDSVVCATGYAPDFTYLDCDMMQGDRRVDFPLYHGVFPLETPQPTLGVLGWSLSNQATPPALEIQARWAALVFSGRCDLPHPDVRTKVWKARKTIYDRQGDIKENIWTIMDAISEEIGAKPTFWKIFNRSPRLALRFLLGPPLPTYYRLFGPGSSEQAWEGSNRSYDISRLNVNVTR